MTKNVSLSFVVCFPRKRSLTERKALSWERKQFLYPLACVYLKRPHTQRHLERLSLSLSLAPKSSSFSSSFREREKETYFFRLLVALSEPISFPYIFLPFQKLYQVVHTLLSHSLSRTHTHTNSAKSMRRWYATAFLCAHSSERVVVRAKKEEERAFVLLLFEITPELMIFERKKAKLPLARNERNEILRAICFRGEKSFRARKRKNCQKQFERNSTVKKNA